MADILQFPQDADLTAENIDVEPMANETQSGGDGGGPGDLKERVVRLETHFEYIQRDLGDIKSDQKETLGKLNSLGADIKVEFSKRPTITGLWAMVATVIGVGLAIAGLTFTIADYAAKVAPGAASAPASAPAVTQPLPAATTGTSTTGGG